MNEDDEDTDAPVAVNPTPDTGSDNRDLMASAIKRQEERSRRVAQLYAAAEERLRTQHTGPDKRDMWLSLAAAFARPTRTGGFIESLGNAADAYRGYRQDRRQSETERNNALDELSLKRAQAEDNSGSSIDELLLKYSAPKRLAFDALGRARDPITGAIVGPATEELPSAQTETIDGRTVIKGPKGTYTPITPVDKWRPASKDEARSYGVTAGQINLVTGEFKATPGVANKLTPAETGVLTEATEALDKGPRVINLLTRALELSPKAHSGKLGEIAQTVEGWIPGASDTETATSEMTNIVSGQALETLRATFGGNPTEGERKILLDLQGSVSMNPAGRAEVLKRAIDAVKYRMATARQNVARVRQGYYSQRSQPPGATAKPRIKIISVEPVK